jgi:hypothetical protein
VYNLRYHIASLVAVFLALSLGLLLGGITVQSGVLTRQRAALVQSLRTDYTKLSKENQGLQSDLTLEKNLASSMVDAAVSGRLDGKSVLVLTNAGRVDGLSATEEAIRDAGGKPIVVTLAKPQLGLGEAEVESTVASALGANGSDLVGRASQALAAEWADGGAGPMTQLLVDAKVLAAPDLPAEGVEGVVDVATFDGKADEGALELALAIQDLGKPGVGAQPRSSKTGLATEASAAGLSALDTLGTNVGRYTLVMLLTGAKPGYYGVGPGTVSLFPPPAQGR